MSPGRIEKRLVHPFMEYGTYCSVLDPQSKLFQDELEKMQKMGARFVTGISPYLTRNLADILENVGISEKRRTDIRLTMLHKGLKDAAHIPTNCFVPQRHIRSHHCLLSQTSLARTNVYNTSLSFQTIRDRSCPNFCC